MTVNTRRHCCKKFNIVLDFFKENCKLEGRKVYLAIADRANCFLRVVLGDSSLVDKHVLLGVVAVDEPVAGLDVEPLDSAGYFPGDDLLFRFSLVVRPSLGLFRLGLRVSHDVNVVLMVT